MKKPYLETIAGQVSGSGGWEICAAPALTGAASVTDPIDVSAPQGGGEPDGHDVRGQVALLLVESLIHSLIARELITVADAVEVVETAAEVRSAIGLEPTDTPAKLKKALAILGSIATSLERDIVTSADNVVDIKPSLGW